MAGQISKYSGSPCATCLKNSVARQQMLVAQNKNYEHIYQQIIFIFKV
jgi:hypothetical protein